MFFLSQSVIDFSTLLRWKCHPERVNSMKNMSKSELSRRRLIPPIPQPVESPEAAQPAEPAEAAAPDVEMGSDGEAGDEKGAETESEPFSESEGENVEGPPEEIPGNN